MNHPGSRWTPRAMPIPADGSLQRQQPDIPVLDRVAVVLEVDRAGCARVAAEAGAGVVDGDRDVLMDRHAVVPDADPGRLDFLAVLALGGVEVDVVALPDGRGLAGV